MKRDSHRVGWEKTHDDLESSRHETRKRTPGWADKTERLKHESTYRESSFCSHNFGMKPKTIEDRRRERERKSFQLWVDCSRRTSTQQRSYITTKSLPTPRSQPPHPPTFSSAVKMAFTDGFNFSPFHCLVLFPSISRPLVSRMLFWCDVLWDGSALPSLPLFYALSF